MPWAQESVLGYTISSSPTGGGPVLLMALAAGAVAAGWPLLRESRLSNRSQHQANSPKQPSQAGNHILLIEGFLNGS